MITIEKADGGYIIGGTTIKRVEPTLESVFTFLLKSFEGRSAGSSAGGYGTVTVRRCKCEGAMGCSQCPKSEAA